MNHVIYPIELGFAHVKTVKKKVGKLRAKKVSILRVHESSNWYGTKAAFLKKKLAPTKMIHGVTRGLPFREIEELRAEIDEPLEVVGHHVSISRSTLQRRRADRRLSPQESDRVLRFRRLVEHATKVFGDLIRARQWLKSPQRGLGGAVPLDYAVTEVGAREVENLLGRIDYGVYS